MLDGSSLSQQVELMKFLVLLSLIGLAASRAHYELLEEWNLWKDQYGRSYGSEEEDLERHIVWLSNKKYIEQHNANDHIFGYTLAMNHFGDMVSFVLPFYSLMHSSIPCIWIL